MIKNILGPVVDSDTEIVIYDTHQVHTYKFNYGPVLQGDGKEYPGSSGGQ
jgi:hypothetical protein